MFFKAASAKEKEHSAAAAANGNETGAYAADLRQNTLRFAVA